MRNNTFRNRFFFVFTLVVLLILSSIGSYGTSNNVFNYNDASQKIDSYLKGKLTWIKTTSSSVINPVISFKDNKLHAFVNNFFIKSNNIIVSNAVGNESYPSSVMEKNNELVAYEYEDGSKNHIYIRNSVDYGESWSDAIRIVANHEDNFDIEINSPSFSLEPIVKKAYGVCKSPLKNSSVLGYFEIDNISSINNIKINTFEFSGLPDKNDQNNTYAFWGFKTPKVVTYRDSSPPGIIVFIGTTNQSTYPCTNSLMFLLILQLDPHQTVLALGWAPGIQNLNNLSISKKYDSRYIYGACEINNGSNQDLLFFKISFGSRDNTRDFIYQILASPENLTHPQIFVEENHIYIVTDSDSRGIVLYKSSNEGNSWDINQVTRYMISLSADPNYPMLYANETHLFSSFIESGNIYLTKSTDYGLNWNVPVQINTENGSVVEEYRFADFPDKFHIFWTDNREGNRDIYSNLFNLQPPSAPAIKGPARGKKGVSYNFTFNSLDPDGDDVSYYVDWGDGCMEDWDGPHASGVDFEISHSFPFEKTFTIEVKAKDTFDFESDWSEFEISIPRTRATIYSLFYWFLERFIILERLLDLIK